MKKSFLIYILLAFLIILPGIKLYNISIKNYDKFLKEYLNITEKNVILSSSPRGKILDVNGKVLVDNIGIPSLVYNSINSNNDDLKNDALRLAEIIDIEEDTSEISLKKFYIIQNNGCNNLITKKEKILLKERKLNKEDIENLKLERITEEMLSNLTDIEKKASHIYKIISTGYYYQNKLIKSGLTDVEIAKINQENIKQSAIVMTWKRHYPYGNTLKNLYGSISTSGVPSDLKEYYDNKNLPKNATVGTSYLELYYDEYLRGKDAIYKMCSNGLELIEKEIPGNDIYLTIDIDKQLYIEKILKEEMLAAKKVKNTDLYNHSYVIVSNPSDGSLVTVAALMLRDDGFVDISSNIINMSYTVGSIVKGATTSVGYANNLINIGERVKDDCIKINGASKKCSWKRLGIISDIDAIAFSSNYFQFLIAIKLSGVNYFWNTKLNVSETEFNIYRKMLGSYGLGEITGIDLPNEKTGIKGKLIRDDLLLNLAIGQYDTYTPIEIVQYINTIANNGKRISPHLMEKITNGTDKTIIKKYETKELDRVELEPIYMDQIKKGMQAVMRYGTGKNYVSKGFSSAGKTGTSETFVDTNNDGKIDTKTTSTAFIMFAPYDNPKYTITILSPNIAVKKNNTSYTYSLNLRLNKKISQYLFEN